MLLKIYLNGSPVSQIHLDTGKEYILGRAKTCDFSLEGTNFSRQHFKLFFNGTNWEAEVLSKYASLFINDQETKNIELIETVNFLCPPYSFTYEQAKENIKIDEVQVTDSENDEDSMNHQEDHSPSYSQEHGLISENEDSDFSEDAMDVDEKTSIGTILSQAFLTIKHTNGNLETLKLEGIKWHIGRNENCEIPLPDTRLSRNHFSIFKEDSKYYIKDLDSSNGTYINDVKLKKSQKVEIQSGDQIKVGGTSLIFEIRDPQFEQRLDNIPMKAFSPNIPAVRGVSDLEFQHQSDLHTSNNSLQPQTNGQPGFPAAVRVSVKHKKNSNKRIHIYLFLILLLCGAGYFYQEQDNQKNELAKEKQLQLASENLTPFSKLDKDKQSLIRNKLNLAFEYFIQGEYEQAIGETRTIHTYLSNGHIEGEKDSKKIENESLKQLAITRNIAKLEKEEKRKQEIQNKIKQTIAYCDRMAKPGTQISSAKQCLSYVEEYDPENPAIERIIHRLQSHFDREARKKQSEAYYQSQVRKGEILFKKAKKTEAENKPLQAIREYQKHINSNFPDPKNLKKESKSQITAIETTLTSTIETLYTEASSLYENQNYKESIYKLRRILDIDPSISKAQELLETVTRELNNLLKAKYTESTLLEDQGDIDAAKDIWHSIKKMDVQNGNYYRKADSKLRKYGA